MFVFVSRKCGLCSVTGGVHLSISNRSVSFHLLYKHIRAEIIKVKVKFAQEQAAKAQRGSRYMVLLFL